LSVTKTFSVRSLDGFVYPDSHLNKWCDT